jgi:hypothetical protein
VLQAGDRLTIGPLEFRLRPATEHELGARPTAQGVAASPPDAPVAQPPIAATAARMNSELNLRRELEEQISSLRAEIVRQNQKLHENLAQQSVQSASLANRRALEEAEQRLRQAEHKERHIRDLLAELSRENAGLLERQQVQDRQGRAELAELRSALEREQAHVRQERDRLSAEQTSLAGERSRLDQREGELATRQRELETKGRQLRQESDSLEQRRAELARREAQFEQRERRQQDPSSPAPAAGDSDQHAQLAVERGRLEEQQLALEAQQRILDEARRRLEQDRAEFDIATAHLDQRRAAVNEEAAQLENQRQQLRREREELSSREDQLELRQKEFAARSAAAQQSADDAGRESERASESEAELERLRIELQSERESLARERASFAAAQAQHQAEHAARVAQQRDWEASRMEFVNRQAELDQANVELDAFRRGLEAERRNLDEERRSLEQSREAWRRSDAVAEHRPGPQMQPAFANERPLHAEPEATSAESGATNDLRQTLASMFGIRDLDHARSHHEPQVDEPGSIRDAAGEELRGSEEPNRPSMPDRYQTSAEEEHFASERSVAALPRGLSAYVATPAQSAESDSPTSDADDRDSIAAYMERLLARNRPNKNRGGESEFRPVVAQVPTSAPIIVTPDSTLDESGSSDPAQPVAEVSREPRQPRHQQDKDAVRANLNSLREVANLSARTAIARHSGKQLKDKLLVKLLLTTACFVVGLVLLTSKWWGHGAYATYGWGALGLGIVTGMEMLARSLGLVSLSKMSAGDTPEGQPEVPNEV